MQVFQIGSIKQLKTTQITVWVWALTVSIITYVWCTQVISRQSKWEQQSEDHITKIWCNAEGLSKNLVFPLSRTLLSARAGSSWVISDKLAKPQRLVINLTFALFPRLKLKQLDYIQQQKSTQMFSAASIDAQPKRACKQTISFHVRRRGTRYTNYRKTCMLSYLTCINHRQSTISLPNFPSFRSKTSSLLCHTVRSNISQVKDQIQSTFLTYFDCQGYRIIVNFIHYFHGTWYGAHDMTLWC